MHAARAALALAAVLFVAFSSPCSSYPDEDLKTHIGSTGLKLLDRNASGLPFAGTEISYDEHYKLVSRGPTAILVCSDVDAQPCADRALKLRALAAMCDDLNMVVVDGDEHPILRIIYERMFGDGKQGLLGLIFYNQAGEPFRIIPGISLSPQMFGLLVCELKIRLPVY